MKKIFSISKKQGDLSSKLMQFVKYAAILVLGGAGYYTIEILWRGHSHWSMALCGGLCLLAMYGINKRFHATPIIFRALVCAAAITVVEFVTGCIVNLWLGWQIWDYRETPFNLLGQVCLLFSFLWFLLSLPICFICDFSNRSHTEKTTEKNGTQD